MEKNNDVISQARRILHAPSMQLSQYLFSRKGGQNFLERVKPSKDPTKRNRQSTDRLGSSSFGVQGEGDMDNEGATGGSGSPRNGSPRQSKLSGSRGASRNGSLEHDNSEMQEQRSKWTRAVSGPADVGQDVPVGSESLRGEQMPGKLKVPNGAGSPGHKFAMRAGSHESMGSRGSRGSRSDQGSGKKEQQSVDETFDVADDGGAPAPRKLMTSMQELDLKPRSKATSSQKALIQKQRLRSMSKSNLNIKAKSRFPLLSGWCLRIVDHTAFVCTVVLVIIIQSVYMGLEDEGSLVVDVLFAAFYFIELTMRLIAYGSDFLKSAFNLMDLGLIVLSFVDLLIVIIQGSSSLDVMVSLRLTRLLRLGGLVRLLRFFKPLYLLVAGIMVSLKTVVWAWILMSLIIYVFGLVFYRALKPDLCTAGTTEEDLLLGTYFGTLSLSMFTVFQITTLEDWPNISEVMAKYQEWLSVMVILLLLLTAYGVMNVTVAIFVNSAMDASSVRSRDIAKKAKEEGEATCKSLQQVFMDADNDGNGTLSKEEFEKAISEKNLLGRLHSAGIDVESAAQLFDILDMDGSGTLDGNEFVEGVLRSRGYAQNKDLVGLRCDVWRANLSVQEEIRLVSLYFEERLAETKEKIQSLKEVACPVLHRAAEEVRKKPDLKKGRTSHGAVVIGAEQSTDDHDESLMSIGARPSEGSRGLYSAPLSLYGPPGLG